MALITSVDAKQHARDLIDRIPTDQVGTAIRFLEFMLLDPVAHAIATVPPDDEPVTAEDARRLEISQTAFAEGKGIPMEELLGEFGLTMDDFPLPSK